eukprot:TRINITY_DN63757_c0_g1_i1.p1 TRINITY_DN63757_c0_g1~~TRINITY_DN63757_c0_g1_i1.p1  ORF type:complete len:482 (+),score=86.84 TRINITY_DN63757_c0_g1_i1:135-1580(+)
MISAGGMFALAALAGPKHEVISEKSGGYFNQDFYHMTIIPLLTLTAVLGWLARPSTNEQLPPGFKKFAMTYLSVWGVCVAADWLQGPYVYALYAAYGFSGDEIAQLFVAGFGASLFFGAFAGCVADTYGRKNTCLLYCFLYGVSCMTKHFNSFSILLVGRITGGIATSLLFSSFECWMVSEHTVRHKFSGELLSYLFGLKYTLMYCVAIVAGLVAQAGADTCAFEPIAKDSIIYSGGSLVPFDLSILCLIAGGALITTCFQENYGNKESGNSQGIFEQTSQAVRILFSDMRSFRLCLIVACFEGAMFAFVFNWTPALASKEIPPPFGVIFALFMMACMCGSSASTLISESVTAKNRLAGVCLCSVIAFMMAGVCAKQYLAACFASFLIFEFCVGAYFPAVGVMKSDIVPEHCRGTMYNLYRVPLNGIVVALLLTHIPMMKCFKMCAILVGIAFFSVTGMSAFSGKAGAEEYASETTPLKTV